MKGPILVAAASGLALLAACSLAPEYHAPDTLVPAAYKEAGEWTVARPVDGVPRGAWWAVFGDKRLDQLEERVTGANQDLKAAVARFAEARAAAEYARAFYFPTVSANAAGSRQRTSTTTANQFPVSVYNNYLVGADVSYEIDVFGRIRNTATQAAAKAQASAGDLATLDLSLHAEVATDYFTLRGYDAQQAVLDATVIAYEKALRVTNDRHSGGIAPELDIDQAETQLETARTQATDTRLKRAQLEHAIAILVGVPPAQFTLPAMPLEAAAHPPAIDPGLPSLLLERRPDVASAERLVAAANANIGVARAAYYPVFDLDAMLGFESALPANWMSAPSRIWSFGPSSLMTLVDGGQIRALNDQARASYDETVADYRQTVLGAFRDVEDALAALHLLAQEARSQGAAFTAAQRALTQAQDQYEGGLVNYLEVVVNENTALGAQLATIDILTRQMTASVLLVKALGGGWQSDELINAGGGTKPVEASAAKDGRSL